MEDYSSACFPAELDYAIIDHLANDRRSLVACSLVCRSWVPAAHSHLFRTIRIQSTAVDGRFSAFAAFLQKSQRLTTRVRNLHLSCDPSSADEERRVPEKVDLRLLSDIVTQLTALERLTLTGISLQPAPSGSINPPLAPELRLAALHITGCHFHDENIATALDVVRLFAAVDDLSFGGYWSLNHVLPQPLPPILPSSTEIRHVQFDMLGERSIEVLCNFLGGPGNTVTTLESAHLICLSHPELQASRRFLEDAASGLKKLELEPTDQYWELQAFEDHFYDLDLSRCVQLESLRLHLNYSYLSYETDGYKCFFDALAAYTYLLALHPPPFLRHLALKIPYHHEWGVDDFTDATHFWAALDKAVSNLAFLTRLTLEIRTVGDLPTSVKGRLLRRFRFILPRLRKKELVQVEFKGTLFEGLENSLDTGLSL